MNANAFLSDLNDTLQAPRFPTTASFHVLTYYGGRLITASLAMRADEAKAVYAQEAPWFPIDEGWRSNDGRTLIVATDHGTPHAKLIAQHIEGGQ